MRKLFFDIQITGHHSEYINHLVDYLISCSQKDTYYFVVHPEFYTRFSSIVEKTSEFSNIHWVYLEQTEVNLWEKSGILKRSIATYRIMNRYALDLKVDHVVLLFLNTFQFALGLYKSSYTISGILFKQFYRMKKSDNYWTYYRKFFQTWVVTRNRKITAIHILNDFKTVKYLNAQFNTDIFKMLPDPIPVLSPQVGFDIYQEYKIPKDKLIFLHIGSLSERKGTLDILEATELLTPVDKSRVFILLVGKAPDGLGIQITNWIKDEKRENMVYWDNEFVSNEKMKSLFDQCFCVLMPYKNSEASSGILGHAAAANKMVIATGKGLLKDIVNEYSLGILVNTVEPLQIAKAISDALNTNYSNTKGTEFVKTRTASDFSNHLLKCNG